MLFLCCFLHSCNSKKNDEFIIGRWKIANLSNSKFLIPQNLQQKIKSGIYLEFHKNGSFQIEGFSENIQKGNYRLNDLGILEITPENSTSSVIDTIYELNENKLIFVDPSNNKYVAVK